MRAVPLRIQQSSECAGIALWRKTIDFGRIDPAGDQRGRHLADVRAQLRRIDIDRQRVEVGKEEQALGLVLHPHPAQDRAEQIAEMEAARRLDARDDAFHGAGWSCFSRPAVDEELQIVKRKRAGQEARDAVDGDAGADQCDKRGDSAPKSAR